MGSHGSDIWIVISKDFRIALNLSGFHGSCQPKGFVSVAHFSKTPRVWTAFGSHPVALWVVSTRKLY